MTNNRYLHIDMARGVAMILVVMGHSCLSTQGDLNKMILSFHMPLFFFLSGIFAKEYTFERLLGGVSNKIKKILIPQLLLALLVTILKIAPYIIKGQSLANFDWIVGLRYWFLPTLFFCSVIFMVLSCVLDMNKRLTQIIIVSISTLTIWLTLYVFDISNSFFAKYLKLVPVAFLFYQLGSIFKAQSLSQGNSNKLAEATILLAAPILFIVSQWNTSVRMYLSDYGSFPLFLICSILGIFLVVQMTKQMKTFNILVDIGQMSIAIYVWNFIVVEFTKIFFLYVLKMAGLYTSGAHVALTFVVSIVLLYYISKLTLRYFPWLYGTKTQQ